MRKRSFVRFLLAALLTPPAVATEPVDFPCIVSTPELDLVSSSGDLVILGSDDEGAPIERGRLAIPGGIWGIAVEGDLAIVASGSDTVLTVDLGDPDQPERRGVYLPKDVFPHVSAVAIAGERGYLIPAPGRLDDALIFWGGDGDLRIVNADLPGPPVEIGAWADGGFWPHTDRLD
ncbi:MAG: hypothetical protein CME06_01695 [Gemmatimonadetes bacterium]|nr:hypothetical protein [Gemmatimonadota bacterium]